MHADKYMTDGDVWPISPEIVAAKYFYTRDDYLSMPDHDDWAFPAGQITIERGSDGYVHFNITRTECERMEK